MRRWIGIVFVLAGMAAASAVLASGIGGATSEMVGAERCRVCHATAYDVWSQSHHARAHASLSEKQASDPRCLQCHGAGVPGKVGVQCETCHGTGLYYASRHVMKDSVLSRIVGLVEQGKVTCARCHTDTTPSIEPFEFERMWALISHGQDPEPEKPAE